MVLVELYDVMRSTPAVREFTDDPFPDDVLQRVLDNARFAPSGGNRQGWRVVVVRDEAARRRLRDLYLRSWTEYHQPVFRRLGPDVEGVPAAVQLHIAGELGRGRLRLPGKDALDE